MGAAASLLLVPSLSLSPSRARPLPTDLWGRSRGAHQHLRHLRSMSEELPAGVIDRKWMLPNPGTDVHQISVLPETRGHPGESLSMLSFSKDPHPFLGDGLKGTRERGSSFYIVRDDLLHPLVNGNKARKLDAVLPILQEHSATDVVTCGGCQSAHTAAVAVSCAEMGIRSHLLLRGEQPDIPTGYNLVSLMYGNTTYIARSAYAKREEMLSTHANLVAGHGGTVMLLDDILDRSFAARKPEASFRVEKSSRKVVIINEGAGNAAGLLGLIRLVKYLSQTHLFGTKQQITLVVDAGTGTTAVGLGLGIACLGLPWKIIAVMLADTIEGYKNQENHLISDFKRIYGLEYLECALSDGIIHWVERIHSRKFGKVLKGEVETCRHIAQRTGILVDPVYTLSAWEQAVHLCRAEYEGDAKVVMLHTGGTLGMFGLAQRYKLYFHVRQGDMPDEFGSHTFHQ